jgi:NAD(P)-dependent dehydrogenase (short-subunit alcohol dehydrogenase family)
MSLAGRVSLVTGGATGIGRTAAVRYAREGARVAIADVNEAEGAAAVAEIEALGREAFFVRTDVRVEAEVQAAVDAVESRWGRLHVLLTAAGILQGAFVSIDDFELEMFARVMDVNTLGTFLSCKHAVPLIERSGGGVILCVASGAGIRGGSSSLVYGASKGGVNGFCMTLERQLEPRGIRVNVVCPGSINTPLKRQNIRDAAVAQGVDPERHLAETRLGDPEAVASILAFLASSEADYLVGPVFTR